MVAKKGYVIQKKFKCKNMGIVGGVYDNPDSAQRDCDVLMKKRVTPLLDYKVYEI